MNQVTRILSAIGRGDQHAAAQLLPLVYDELRKLASQRMAGERPAQTLQATALVHEAYLRLVDGDGEQDWNGRGHFFAAAAEAMRRILVEKARRRQRLRHGGGRQHLDLNRLDSAQLAADDANREADGAAVDELVALDQALARLADEDPATAQIVKLRYFAGLTIERAAEAAGVSVRTANRHWAYAKAWLYQQLNGRSDDSASAT
jgi:RNA polymerase sigma factor (TIGR02999 family)